MGNLAPAYLLLHHQGGHRLLTKQKYGEWWAVAPADSVGVCLHVRTSHAQDLLGAMGHLGEGYTRAAHHISEFQVP